MNSCWFTRLKHRNSPKLNLLIEKIDKLCSEDYEYIKLLKNRGKSTVIEAIDQFISNYLRAKYMLKLNKIKSDSVIFATGRLSWLPGTHYYLYGFIYRLYIPLFKILIRYNIISSITGNSKQFTGTKGFSTTYRLLAPYSECDSNDIFYIPAMNTMEANGMKYKANDDISINRISNASNYSDYVDSVNNYLRYNSFIDKNDIYIDINRVTWDKNPERFLRMETHPLNIEYSKPCKYDPDTNTIIMRLAQSSYQMTPSKIRSATVINNKPCVEVDYAGMYIHIAYSTKGKKCPTNYYSFLPELSEIANRKLSKMLVNFNIAGKNKKSVKYAIESEWQSIASENGLESNLRLFLSSYGLSYDIINQRLFEVHSDVSDYLEGTKRDSLEMLQASLMEKVMVKFMDLNIVVLDVHDSFVCQEEISHIVRNYMICAFKEKFGTDIIARIKG